MVGSFAIGEADTRLVDLVDMYIASAMDDLRRTDQHTHMRDVSSLRIDIYMVEEHQVARA